MKKKNRGEIGKEKGLGDFGFVDLVKGEREREINDSGFDRKESDTYSAITRVH